MTIRENRKVFRAALLVVPALSLLLAPVGAQARPPEDPFQEERVPGLGVEGPAGAISEFNYGPPGTDIRTRSDWEEAQEERVLSGRVVERQGQTLYVERDGVVVPLDLRALRLTQEPRAGQEIIAAYQVRETANVALSLAGAVE